ncbi:hypothetical protein [Streptomyces sp. CRN 30]|uniref:hypothetical protein n=1 Tax=Streptomyces sp. CRN 30 TaxID=3075613 RepID=UPI002A7F04F2|nr:hypothetical protein [Streptomyces sp. CRN 30]
MHTAAQTPVAHARAGGAPASLRKLYFLRFGFAAVWAGLLFATATDLGPLGVTLLLIYPLFDVASAVVDIRSAKAAGSTTASLYINVVISSVAVLGLAVAATSGIPAVLRVWGAWAIASGLVQLITAVTRRKMGGQWAMILSGGISTLAGASFAAQAGTGEPTLSNLAGYAFLGGVFFLVSALRLNGSARGDS